MESFFESVRALPTLPPVAQWAVLVVALAAAILAAASAIAALRARNALQRFLNQALKHAVSPHALLPSLVSRAQELDARLHKAQATLTDLEAAHTYALQHWHLVRFNPFHGDGTGGNQSFSLALMDGTRSGVIITAIHGRDRTRVYGKAVVRGVPQAPLSAEEEAALHGALQRAHLSSSPLPERRPSSLRRIAREVAKEDKKE